MARCRRAVADALALEARGNFGRGDGLFGMADHRKVARQALVASILDLMPIHQFHLSREREAELLAVFVVDTTDTALTTPDR